MKSDRRMDAWEPLELSTVASRRNASARPVGRLTHMWSIRDDKFQRSAGVLATREAVGDDLAERVDDRSGTMRPVRTSSRRSLGSTKLTSRARWRASQPYPCAMSGASPEPRPQPRLGNVNQDLGGSEPDDLDEIAPRRREAISSQAYEASRGAPRTDRSKGNVVEAAARGS